MHDSTVVMHTTICITIYKDAGSRNVRRRSDTALRQNGPTCTAQDGASSSELSWPDDATPG